MKNIYKFILILFFILILAVPVYWLTKGESTPEESMVEARTLVALGPSTAPNLQRALDFFEDGKIFQGLEVLLDLYTNASFVGKFERATSDQLPFRMPIFKFSKWLDREIIKFVYRFVNDPVIPADMTSGIYYDSINNQLLQPVTLFNETMRAQIDERIENYQELIDTHPEQNFYLYYHQTIHNSPFHPMTQYFEESDNGQAIDYFKNHLPEGLTIAEFPLTGMDDHLKYYYRTDHHWNVFGMLRAYEEIYNMLSKDFTQISPKLGYERLVTFPDIEFLGYMARLTFYPIKGDSFIVEVVEIPPHEMKMSGQIVEQSSKQVYFNGNYSTIPFANHFNEFYGNVTNLIEYTYNNDSGRNLLIIGSSFRNALDPLLASHYEKTFCIDLRYYPDFSLSNFLSEHKVDDILIVGDNEVGIENVEYWKINP